MSDPSQKRWGLLGDGLRTDGPSERPPEPTLPNALLESGRLLRKLAVGCMVAGVAGGLGFLLGGPRWFLYGAFGVLSLLVIRLVGEVLLGAFVDGGEPK